MSSTRWDNRIKDVVHAAMARPSEERQSFVADACADDVELFDAVSSLVEAVDHSVDFLESGAHTMMGDTLPEEPTKEHGPDASGRRLGAYRLLRRIGAGGMGDVYLAERADEEYDKQVAVKIVPRGSLVPLAFDRFKRERQMLATLEHPHIARLLDGGASDEGEPYLVMEYVEGISIVSYGRRHHLSIRQRLELMLDVSSAVQHAHESLIIHRDLKPGNILVTKTGVPKLLDFGIADVVREQAAPADAPREAGMRLATPRYASPEQIEGRRVGVQTDVYSLGVILYELLTGRLPYDVDKEDGIALRGAIISRPPTLPSRVADFSALHDSGVARPTTDRKDTIDHKWRRQLRGDIDAILLKALAKTTVERYNSVEQFAEDIRRHLTRWPVHARKPTYRYVATRFLARNRIIALATASVILALIIGIVGTVTQARNASHQRDAAIASQEDAEKAGRQLAEEADRARRLVALMREMLSSADPQNDELGRNVCERLERFAQRIDADLAEQPIMRAAILDTIGNIFAGLGRYREAGEYLQTALALRRKLTDIAPTEVAESLVSLASCMRNTNKYEDAERLYREALVLRRSELGDDHLDVATTMMYLAMVLERRADYDRAEHLYRRALDLARRLVGDNHRITTRCLNGLANLHVSLGEFDKAERIYRRNLETNERLYESNHPFTLTARSNLAELLIRRGEFAEAEALSRELLDSRIQIFGAEHPDVAATLHTIGCALAGRQRLDSAKTHLRRALEMRRRLLGDMHTEVAETLQSLASVLAATEHKQESGKYLRECLMIRIRVLGRAHPDVAWVMSDYAERLASQGRHNDAAKLFFDAMRICEAKLPREHWLTQQISRRQKDLTDHLHK